MHVPVSATMCQTCPIQAQTCSVQRPKQSDVMQPPLLMRPGVRPAPPCKQLSCITACRDMCCSFFLCEQDISAFWLHMLQHSAIIARQDSRCDQAAPHTLNPDTLAPSTPPQCRSHTQLTETPADAKPHWQHNAARRLYRHTTTCSQQPRALAIAIYATCKLSPVTAQQAIVDKQRPVGHQTTHLPNNRANDCPQKPTP